MTMDASNDPRATMQTSQQTAERIKQLGEISKKISQVLQHGGQAINALTRNPLPEDAGPAGDMSGSLAARRAAFKKSVDEYYALLNEVAESLKEEADALVQAGLLPSIAPKKGILGENVTNEGLGNLDVGYLNSRTRDVGLVKEAELVKEMRRHLERLAGSDTQPSNGDAMDET